jgi:hypothetical protein
VGGERREVGGERRVIEGVCDEDGALTAVQWPRRSTCNARLVSDPRRTGQQILPSGVQLEYE